MKTIKLNDGTEMPRLGMGTWYIGEGYRSAGEEEQALCAGIDAGMPLIDTAEMYGDGRAEELVGRVLKQRSGREVYLVSKVYPHNAGKNRIFKACEASLRRLGVEKIDLYLLHWRGSVPLQETVDCLQELVKRGKIARWGVSNFDLEDMQELLRCRAGERCSANQVLYHLGSRGIEFSLAPFLKSKGIAVMAYCPLAQAGRLQDKLLSHPAVNEVARRQDISPVQVLLGFVLQQENMVAIPRSGSAAHVLQNAQMAEKPLAAQDLALLNSAFPAPKHRVALDME